MIDFRDNRPTILAMALLIGVLGCLIVGAKVYAGPAPYGFDPVMASRMERGLFALAATTVLTGVSWRLSARGVLFDVATVMLAVVGAASFVVGVSLWWGTALGEQFAFLHKYAVGHTTEATMLGIATGLQAVLLLAAGVLGLQKVVDRASA